jgi:hypothetical protein
MGVASLSSRRRKAIARESPAARRMRRRTRALGIFAGTSVLTMLAAEVARVWRLGSLARGRGDDPMVGDRRRPGAQVLRIINEGYHVSSTRQNALFNMLVSYVVTFGTTRFITYRIRYGGAIGPIRDIQVGSRHVHHFLPGAVVAFLSGGYSIAARNKAVDRWLAIPFGIGTALVLDESALLLELDDVYWSEEGIVSVQITLAALALLSGTVLALRVLRRGEQRVLQSQL